MAGDVGDSPATGRDGHTLPRLHAVVEFQPGQLRPDLTRHIFGLRSEKRLADSKNLGEVSHRQLQRLETRDSISVLLCGLRHGPSRVCEAAARSRFLSGCLAIFRA